MKVLYVITQAELGGAQRYVLDLAAATGGEIAVGTEQTALFEEAQRRGVTIHSLRHLKRNINLLEDLAAVGEIQNLIKSAKPDIVHLNSSKAGLLGSCAAIGTGVKVVFTAHGFVFNEPLSPATRWLYRFLERFASYFRNIIIAVSEADRESALRYHIADPAKIVTVHNGIDETDFLDKASARQELNLDPNKLTIGTVGHFYKNKGFDTLIQALALSSPDYLDKVQTVMVGGGQEMNNIKYQISNSKLESKIKLTGPIPNASKYLKAFDVFVLPSRKEGFSYILLEAMQAGLPIVATDVGGNKEALSDAGLIVPANDAQALADAIKKLIKDDQLRLSLVEKSCERSKLFTKQKMVAKTLAVYQKLLDNK